MDKLLLLPGFAQLIRESFSTGLDTDRRGGSEPCFLSPQPHCQCHRSQRTGLESQTRVGVGNGEPKVLRLVLSRPP